MCLCGVRCVGMCVCVEPERHKQTGRGGPQSVPLPLLSSETKPLKPTPLCRKKTENNNKSKQRTSLLSPNGFKSSLPVVTADERIIKHRTVLTERSHTVQALIHSTTVCLCMCIQRNENNTNFIYEQRRLVAFCKNRSCFLIMSDGASQ